MAEGERGVAGDSAEPHVLWLTPDKPDTISVGRQRIADCLRADGFRVTLRGTTSRTVLAALQETDDYDIIIGTTRAGAFAGSILKLLGTPFVVDHIDPIRQFAETNSWPLAFGVRLAENVAFRLADHVLYVYDEERPRIERYAHATTETELGVAFERFADPDPETLGNARERLATAGVETDDQTMIYVGGLEPIYHIEELLESMEHLDDWTLVVLGAGTMEGRVERAADEYENVVFLGSIDHEAVPGYLHAADIGISLVDDSHTLKILEYAAAELAVVGLRGRAEARFGEFVESCEPTPEGIARAVARAGGREESEAFRTAVKKYDYDRVADTYGKVLKAVVRSN